MQNQNLHFQFLHQSNEISSSLSFALTVRLNFDRSTVKHARQNIQNTWIRPCD